MSLSFRNHCLVSVTHIQPSLCNAEKRSALPASFSGNVSGYFHADCKHLRASALGRGGVQFAAFSQTRLSASSRDIPLARSRQAYANTARLRSPCVTPSSGLACSGLFG